MGKPLVPVEADKVLPVMPERDVSEMSPAERLDHAVKEVRKHFGEDWNPLVRLVELSEQAAAEGDIKTAITGYQTVADRYAPKLKAVEVRHSTDVPSVIELRPVEDDSPGQSGHDRIFEVD